MKTRTALSVVTIVIIATVSACCPAQPLEPTLTPASTHAVPTSPPTLTLAPTPTGIPRPVPTIPSAVEFHVNPIDGLIPDFIMGADVSMLAQIEASGGKFYAQGVEKDCLEILRDHGVNWIRLRIWNDPTDKDGKPLGGGNNDLDRTVEIAARAKALGFKFLLDFHYSDWWADPSKQDMPKAWVGLDSSELNHAIYDYTAEVVQTLADAGAMPDMVQIGNEVNGGMLWPAGKIWAQGSEEVGGYDGFAELLKQGIQAIRDNDSHSDDPEKRVRIAIHLADGGNNELYRSVFDELTARNVDFDVIGLSYYNFWHGPMERFISNMNDISKRYQKDVVILETAYAYTLADSDGYPNLLGGGDKDIGDYKPTVQGQATAIRDVMLAVAEVPNDRGLGIFYWETEWIAAEGAGWATGQGNAWENLALFDFDGNALPSIDVFNQVRPEHGGVSFAPLAMEVYATIIYVPLDERPDLPPTVKVVCSNDAIRDVPVAWEPYDPALLDEVGSFTLKGAVEGTDRQAIVTVYTGSPKNYLKNPGFENGFTAWVLDGSSSAVDVGNEAQNVYNGGYALHYWAEGPFEFTVSQTVTGLENGTYTFSVWMQGGEKTSSSFMQLTIDAVNTGWQEWQNPSIENITVTTGQCTIGLRVVSDGGTWGFFDEAGLFQNE